MVKIDREAVKVPALDIDARMAREFGEPHCEARCHPSNVAAHVVDGIAYPMWERQRASQRDYAAEAAGY